MPSLRSRPGHLWEAGVPYVGFCLQFCMLHHSKSHHAQRRTQGGEKAHVLASLARASLASERGRYTGIIKRQASV